MNTLNSYRSVRGGLIALVGALAFAPLAQAHHSTAMFDMVKTVEVQGTIKSFQWTNPHTFTYVTVAGDSPAAGEYGIEGMSPNYLARNGWSRHSLTSGEKVTMQIHPLKDGRKGGFMVSVTLPDGKTIYNLPVRGGVDPSKTR